MKSKKILEAFALLLSGSTLILIFVGALVKSHEAGLSVPDWPTTYGENMFLYHPSKWIGGIFFEHGHRLLASFIGLITLILACLSLKFETHRWVQNIIFFALFLVVLQGLLGGLTVRLQLPLAVSAAHGILAQLFFITTCLIAYLYSDEFQTTHVKKYTGKLFKISLGLVLIIFIQLVLGAIMRHAEAGLAVPDFPTIGGSLIPWINQSVINNINSARFDLGLGPANNTQIILHLLHRFWGIFSFIIIIFATRKICIERTIFSSNIVWILLITFTEVCLGIFTILSGRTPYLTSAHVMLGAVLLATCSILMFRIYVHGFKNNS